MKIEYKVVTLWSEGQRLEVDLNELGAQGWDLFERRGDEFIFKRHPEPELPLFGLGDMRLKSDL